MKNPAAYPALLAAALVAAAIWTAGARPISAVAQYHLTAPATEAITKKTAEIAAVNFRTDCVEWIKEETGTSLDSSNAIWNYHLTAFTDSCLRIARRETSFQGHEFVVSITLSEEDAHAALQAHNARCQAISLSTWTRLKNSLESNLTGDAFQLGVQTIFYGMGRIEKTVEVPGENEPGFFMLDDARKIVQDFISRITIHSETFVISGKPGALADNFIVLRTTLDTLPLPNFGLLGKIGRGKKMFSGKTGFDGTFTVKDFKIPYVAKGTFLYVESDFGAAVNNVCSFTANDLGLTFPEQTILFNTVPPTYVLNYKALAASKVEIPKDFKSDAFIKKFLHDSCFIAPAADPAAADLVIDITTQVSCYSSDSTETTDLKVEDAISIRNALNGAKAEKTSVVHEKSFENSIDLPIGLFFWEAAGKSTAMIKTVFNEL